VVAVVAALTLGGVALGGCTAPPPSIDPTRVVPADLPVPPPVENAREAKGDLASISECSTEPGEQTVSGRITSSQKQTIDYLVTVNWTTDTGELQGRGFVVVPQVQPGETERFMFEAQVAPGATQCVVEVQAGTLP
jgi:hypothetical protein